MPSSSEWQRVCAALRETPRGRARAGLERELYRFAVDDGRRALLRMSRRLSDDQLDDLLHDFLATRLRHVIEGDNPRAPVGVTSACIVDRLLKVLDLRIWIDLAPNDEPNDLWNLTETCVAICRVACLLHRSLDESFEALVERFERPLDGLSRWLGEFLDRGPPPEDARAPCRFEVGGIVTFRLEATVGERPNLPRQLILVALQIGELSSGLFRPRRRLQLPAAGNRLVALTLQDCQIVVVGLALLRLLGVVATLFVFHASLIFAPLRFELGGVGVRALVQLVRDQQSSELRRVVEVVIACAVARGSTHQLLEILDQPSKVA